MRPPDSIRFAVRLDEVRAARVQPSTLVRYRQHAATFVEWCRRYGMDPWSASDWDAALCEWRADAKPSKFSFENTFQL